MDFKIRQNNDGPYLILYANALAEGVGHALKSKVGQIQLRGFWESEPCEVDLSPLEKLAPILKVLSLSGFAEAKDVRHPDTLRALSGLEKLYVLEKQNFEVDLAAFPKLHHLGAEYWKGLTGLDRAINLKSLVLVKYPKLDLSEISSLESMNILHVYQSKITSLLGIENLQRLTELVLSRNASLTDISTTQKIPSLKRVRIEKCSKLESQP